MARVLLALVLVSTLSAVASAQQARDPGWVDNVPTSERQYDPNANRVMLYFLGEVGGEANVEVGGFEGDANLDATLGFGTRFEAPISDFFAIGGGFEFFSLKVDDFDRDGDFGIDIYGVGKGRHVIEITPSIDLEVFGALLLGFTAFFGEDGNYESAFGFNLGLLGGAALMIGRIGIMTELGLRHRHVYGELDGGGDYDIRTRQFAFHFGGVFTL